jgi:hypothetical protein
MRAFAPGLMTIVFSPAESTTMSARPEGASGSVRRCVTPTASRELVARHRAGRDAVQAADERDLAAARGRTA